jgi:hypothetical protein
LPLIGDWLMRRFRKLRASFASSISTEVQAELRAARSSGGPALSAEFMPTRRILIKDPISKHHTFDKERTDV